MKTYNTNQVKYFQDININTYQVVYEQIYAYNLKASILKPYDLSFENLQTTPILVLVHKIKSFEILFEFRIRRLTQIIELFKILQRLNFSRNSIANMLISILTNWNHPFKNKDLELLIYHNTPKEFYKTIFQNDKQETFKDTINNQEYIKTDF
ncbi:hypothetical protein B5M19_04075 [Mesomycoplasma hyopneumoniae]|uniref:hypothetical protein n=1 Tax=Mesomycoplasma hyopneumoniae TaxID=2099 RepID=UPI000B543369|nr:hypothetical protein [Mesomycoplasma hyopneumoniae]OWY73542.1 hypothetical protein B5M19_04075 [Mesomycoplasma hyopneumoniae]